MNSNFTRAALLALLSLAGGAELLAQKFTNNTGGTYTAVCNAVIRLKSTGSPAPAVAVPFFDGTAALGQNNGATAIGPIQGIVDYTSAAGGQQVQGAFYTTLFLSGGAKTVLTGVHIYGNACASAATTGYAALVTMPYSSTSASTVYQGTFNYDAPAGSQIIFAENGASANTNRYSALNLAGGAKSTTGAITIDGALTSTAGTPLTIGANFNIANNTIASPTNVVGSISVANGGTLTQSGTSAINIAATTGSVTVAAGGALTATTTGTGHINVLGNLTLDPAGTGTLALASGTYLDINGSFTNGFAAKTNMTFDPASTVAYTGGSAQTLIGTSNASANNKYGNLVFTGAGSKTADGNVYAVNSVKVEGGAVIIPTANVFDLDVTAATARVSYTSALTDNVENISGKLNLSGTLLPATTYTMNNKETQVAFSAVPNSFQLDVLPATAPTLMTDYSSVTDAKRSVSLSYSGTGAGPTYPGVLSTLRIGYTAADVVSPFTGDEGKFRFVEGFGAAGQKITGGSGIATNSGTTPTGARFVNLAGAIKLNNPLSSLPDNEVGEIGNGSNIVLTSVPNTFIAVNPGRWSNPATWDEGMYPSSTDNAEIRALVYVGIDGDVTSAYGTPIVAANGTSELSIYGATPAANSIVIASGATYANSALIIGNQDNPGFTFHTALTGSSAGVSAGFINNNAVANTGDANVTTTNSGINGLFITNIVTAGSSIFGTALVTNNGTINNYGIIEVGN